MKTPRDPASQRLFLDPDLAAGARIALDRGQANYLVNVLRLGDGAELRVFNGRDGEWAARLASEGKRAFHLVIERQTRPQPPPPDLHYLFAPLKQARLDYMVEKAVEMGAGCLRPVLTQHGQVARPNPARMHANALEAAEQCGLLSVPRIEAPRRLADILDAWPQAEAPRRLIVADESHAGADPLAILARLAASPLAVLIGPEGGFSEGERAALRALPFVTAIPLGPRIMRADTAAVAALALVQATCGDWRSAPPRPYSGSQ